MVYGLRNVCFQRKDTPHCYNDEYAYLIINFTHAQHDTDV